MGHVCLIWLMTPIKLLISAQDVELITKEIVLKTITRIQIYSTSLRLKVWRGITMKMITVNYRPQTKFGAR